VADRAGEGGKERLFGRSTKSVEGPFGKNSRRYLGEDVPKTRNVNNIENGKKENQHDYGGGGAGGEVQRVEVLCPSAKHQAGRDGEFRNALDAAASGDGKKGLITRGLLSLDEETRTGVC